MEGEAYRTMLKKQESEVREWIEKVLGKSLPEVSMHELLKDGVILCEIINKINGLKESEAKFPSHGKASFVQMENIAYFIENARRLGVPDHENFLTVDLFENKNMLQVMVCLCSLSRNLANNGRKDIPVVGPRLARGSPVKFTNEQLEEAKRVVSLQYGCTGGQYGCK